MLAIAVAGTARAVDLAQRAALLAKGWRDDGIAFYTAKTATKTVYRIHYAKGADWQGDNVVPVTRD